jgi:hypothetical protein
MDASMSESSEAKKTAKFEKSGDTKFPYESWKRAVKESSVPDAT